MSADNWGVCPRCKKNFRGVKVDKKRETEAAYGKVSASEYLAMVAELANTPNDEIEETLREDYEIYTDEDGLFVVEYNGECSVCDYHVVFKHREKFAP